MTVEGASGSCGVGAEGASGSCGVGVEGVSDGGGGEVASASKSFTHTSMSSSATPPRVPFTLTPRTLTCTD